MPLFQTAADGLTVQTAPRGRRGQPVLLRSPQMEALVLQEAAKVLSDFELGEAGTLHGLIYAMYTMEGGAPSPLYIGRAGKFGKKGGNLSANLKGIKAAGQHPFARWGYNYAYHLGDLSCAVLGHEDAPSPKYVRWAEALFVRDGEGFTATLKEPVCFWMRAWGDGDIGPWREFGPTTLDFVEYLLIGAASAAFPRLLNEEGSSSR